MEALAGAGSGAAVTDPSATNRGQALYLRAKERIPGGTQLLSKRPEMFLPGGWPSYYSRAKGAEVWDLDGNRYVDMGYSGIGACVLGFADPDVDAAVKEAIEAGSAASLNCPEEVELADLLSEIHPWADRVRFARGGGEAMAIAVRIARAGTGRDKVAFCGYHGWHDWYLAANLAESDALDGHLLPGLSPRGVPRGLTGTALPFRYNRIDELEAIVAMHGPELAAIVMEPMRDQEPAPGFLEEVRLVATRIGAVLIFDEVTAAFRVNSGGIHLTLGVEPDIAVFAKAISNGYPMAAVLGRREAMAAAELTFISSTSWTERIGPAAALATVRKHRAHDVGPRLVQVGERVRSGWAAAAEAADLTIHVGGLVPISHFSFDLDDAQVAMTFFTQQMLQRGFLAGRAFYATFAHTDEHADAYATAATEVFSEVRVGLDRGTLRDLVKGPIAHSGFSRLT